MARYGVEKLSMVQTTLSAVTWSMIGATVLSAAAAAAVDD